MGQGKLKIKNMPFRYKYSLVPLLIYGMAVSLLALLAAQSTTQPVTLTGQSETTLSGEMVVFAKQVSNAHGDLNPVSVSWVVVPDRVAQHLVGTSSSNSALDYVFCVQGDFKFTGRHPSNVDMSRKLFLGLIYVFTDNSKMRPIGFGEVYATVNLS